MMFLTVPAGILNETIGKLFFCTGYISSINSFPKPLAPEEEAEYIEKYRQGDETARNVLIERNLRLVAHVVKKYNNNNQNDMDDLISIGTIGLIKAIKTFNGKRGTKLATYAARCIENEIRMQMRSDKKRQNEVFLQDPIGKDKEGNEITFIDIIKSDKECVINEVALRLEAKKLNNKIQSVLTERERTIIQLRYGLTSGESLTQREIAKMLNISRSYVSRIEKKAIKKLMKEIKEPCL